MRLISRIYLVLKIEKFNYESNNCNSCVQEDGWGNCPEHSRRGHRLKQLREQFLAPEETENPKLNLSEPRWFPDSDEVIE